MLQLFPKATILALIAALALLLMLAVACAPAATPTPVPSPTGNWVVTTYPSGAEIKLRAYDSQAARLGRDWIGRPEDRYPYLLVRCAVGKVGYQVLINWAHFSRPRRYKFDLGSPRIDWYASNRRISSEIWRPRGGGIFGPPENESAPLISDELIQDLKRAETVTVEVFRSLGTRQRTYQEKREIWNLESFAKWHPAKFDLAFLRLSEGCSK